LAPSTTASQPHNRQSTAAPRLVMTGAGHFFPDTVLDNSFYDKLSIGSSAEWIEERVGIRERRSILTHDELVALREGRITRAELIAQGRIMTMAAMTKKPWAMTIERSRLAERGVKIDQVIAGTSIPDWDIPANACSIAGGLGLECTAFDVNSACSSFVVNLHVARSLLLSGAAKTTAIFNAERYTTRIDLSDRSTCVLFGDSAAASLLESVRGDEPLPRGLELLDTFVDSAPSGYEHVRLPDGGCFAQNGKAVQKFATTKTIAAAQQILERNGLGTRDISYFIAHQANLRMLTYAAEKLGIEPSRHLYNVDTCGNQGATGAPTVLSTHWEKYKPGDIIVLSVVGSGLTWGSALFRAV
jgi:3-oxoacyl-[acyl-carrier-protein] synthase-3